MTEEKTIKKKETKKDFSSLMPDLEEMLKKGVHFGHRSSKWNPKMKDYVFGVCNNVYMVDLEKTRKKLIEALDFINNIKEKKQTILFVGTKVAAKEITKETAEKSKMPYVVNRWIGGTLTNFEVISNRLKYYRDLQTKQRTGELKKYTKKEQHDFGVELERLKQRFGGIKELVKLPDALFVVDVHKEKGAVKEANMKNIPVVGLCDTNSDPTLIDYPIPANDDAISSLKLILEIVVKVLSDQNYAINNS